MKPEQEKALIAAGRLLQAEDWPGGPVKIEVRDGEPYVAAVKRAIDKLSPADRAWLRGLVAWILDYEREDERLRALEDERQKALESARAARRNGSAVADNA
jgi:hypothetical protein